MLNKKAIKYSEHVDRDVAAAQDIAKLVEGAIAIEVLEAGVAKMQVSEAIPAATAKIAGVVVLPYQVPAKATAKESYVVKADALVIKLRNEKLDAGSVLVKIAGVVATLDEADFATAPAAAGEVNVDLVNGKLKFHADDADKAVEVVYTHALTMEQAKLRFGEGFLSNRDAVATLHKASVFKGYVELLTSEYDTSVDWAAGGVLKLGANGKLTIGGAGPAIPGGAILAIPDMTQTAQGAFLKFSALIP